MSNKDLPFPDVEDKRKHELTGLFRTVLPNFRDVSYQLAKHGIGGIAVSITDKGEIHTTIEAYEFVGQPGGTAMIRDGETIEIDDTQF